MIMEQRRNDEKKKDHIKILHSQYLRDIYEMEKSEFTNDLYFLYCSCLPQSLYLFNKECQKKIMDALKVCNN